MAQPNAASFWSAEPTEEDSDLMLFNVGDYARANKFRLMLRQFSTIPLYPNDSGASGRILPKARSICRWSSGPFFVLLYDKYGEDWEHFADQCLYPH